jgi:hypothetical protein
MSEKVPRRSNEHASTLDDATLVDKIEAMRVGEAALSLAEGPDGRVLLGSRLTIRPKRRADRVDGGTGEALDLQLRLPFIEEEPCPHCGTAASLSSPDYDADTNTFACPCCALTWTATTRERPRT